MATADTTYKLLLDRTQDVTYVCRNLRGGVCGPWTSPVEATDPDQRRNRGPARRLGP